jgi:hypothetical protein
MLPLGEAMARVFATFLLVLSGAVLAGAQQPQGEAQQDSQPAEQRVITDPAEYNAYINALNTLDPAARKAAFNAFLEKFPNSVMRDEALNQAMDALVKLDNQQTALVRQRPQPIPQKVELTPAERACKLVRETPTEALSIQEWKFILQYRDSGSACNREGAKRVWQLIQGRQKYAQGKPASMMMVLPQVRVLSATAKSIDGAFTDDSQKAGKPDLRVTLAEPLAKPPAPGSTVDIIGTISDYSTAPFMFIMTHGELVVAKRTATVDPGQDTR